MSPPPRHRPSHLRTLFQGGAKVEAWRPGRAQWVAAALPHWASEVRYRIRPGDPALPDFDPLGVVHGPLKRAFDRGAEIQVGYRSGDPCWADDVLPTWDPGKAYRVKPAPPPPKPHHRRKKALVPVAEQLARVYEPGSYAARPDSPEQLKADAAWRGLLAKP